jgi:hypothetical protein
VADNYVLTGSTNRHTDWTTGVVLERDEETGEVTKEVSAVQASELSADDVKRVEELGYSVEKVTKAEAEELAERASAVGGDTAGAAPLFGDKEVANQNRESGSKSNDKS